MLYELVAIVRPGRLSEVKEIAKTTGNIILGGGGVIRGITNWGTFLLPRTVRKHQAVHRTGHYFIVRFDSSAAAQHQVRSTLKLDPRMIRHSVVKLGSALHDIRDVSGKVEWDSMPE